MAGKRTGKWKLWKANHIEGLVSQNGLWSMEDSEGYNGHSHLQDTSIPLLF